MDELEHVRRAKLAQNTPDDPDYEPPFLPDEDPQDEHEHSCTAQWAVGQFHGFTQYETCDEEGVYEDKNGNRWCEEHAVTFEVILAYEPEGS